MEQQIIGSVFKEEEFWNPNKHIETLIFSQVVTRNSRGSLELWKDESIQWMLHYVYLHTIINDNANTICSGHSGIMPSVFTLQAKQSAWHSTQHYTICNAQSTVHHVYTQPYILRYFFFSISYTILKKRDKLKHCKILCLNQKDVLFPMI